MTMKSKLHKLAIVRVLACGWVCLAAAANAQHPPILPTPKSLTLGAGVMPLTTKSRLVVTDPRLDAHAAVLAEEIWLLTGWRLDQVNADARPGDIVLKLNPELRADEDILAVRQQKVVRTRDYAHTVDVSDQAVVAGWDVRAVCEGTATLMQSVAGEKGSFRIPRMKIKDWPHADFTGAMVDCGRQWIPADALKMTVEACRMFKVRYLQLHVGDHEGYSFPSKAFPKLGTQNGACCGGIPPKVWTFQEMRDLETYATARGVTIVPELETPGHHGAMGRCYQDVFDGPGCMDMASEELYKGLDTVIGEMCEVFKSTPYFHIGCDEANWNGVGAGPWAQIYKRRHAVPGDNHGVRNAWEIYVVHMFRMSEIVRKYGKVPIAWENFPEDNRLKDEVIPMIWYPNAVAHRYQQNGWTTITVPWELGVPFPEWNMYLCNGSRLQRTDRVLGASRPMWQMSAICLTTGWAAGVGERQERTWGPDTPINNDEYQQRYAVARERVNRLALPVKLITEGPTMGCTYFLGGQIAFGRTLKVTLAVEGPDAGEIRYTLDGSEPAANSTLYAQPLAMDKSFVLNAAMFHHGRQIGCVTRSRYDWVDTEGYLEDWLVAGPYTVAGKKGVDLFDVAFEPETGGQVKWIHHKPGNPPWLVNLGPIPGFAGDDRVAYIRTKVWSPKAQQALLLVHSDDAVKVFLNGKVVHTMNKGRYANEEDRVQVNFQQGWNQLMMKVINWAGDWQAQGRVRADNGAKFEGLKVQAE